MRAGFDHQIFGLQSFGGISRYVVRLVQELAFLGDNPRVIAPIHRNYYLKTLDPRLQRGRAFARFPPKSSLFIGAANLILCSRWMSRFQPDLLHETYYTAHPIRCEGVPRIVTVHDMIHEKFGEPSRHTKTASEQKRRSVERADHIIAVSQNTKNDLCELFDVPESKVTVVHHGFDQLTPYSTTHENCRTRPFLLYVGQRHGYKNFAGLLKSVASRPLLQKEFDVVAAGGGHFGTTEIELISSLGFTPGSVRQVEVNDNALAGLYRSAAAFVYPSKYEGFGMPPLEAMAQDCPVIASHTSSMPEVIGDAGEYFDPEDLTSTAEAIERVAFDDHHRRALISRGRERLKGFSWKKCAQETRMVYESVIRGGRGIQ